jgi:hypothetical protein
MKMKVRVCKQLPVIAAAAIAMLVPASGESVPPSPDIANSIYQFGVAIPKSATDPLIWNQTNAFLWVPPDCRRIRAVILAPANVIERRFCDDPIVRAEAARDGLAIVFFNAGWKKEIFDTPDCITYVESMLDALADKSGYDELRTIPWIPFGHSGNSSSSQAMAQWKPGRTLANIVVKGKIPGVGKNGSKAAITGIPTLFVTGEFEEVMPPGGVRNAWWTRQMELFHEGRAAVPDSLMTGLEDRSRGHLAWFPDTSSYAAMFIHKAVEARLGADGKLRPVAFDSGWLADPDGKVPAAPAAKYNGRLTDAFWFFDREQERAWESLQNRDKGKKEQLLAFDQDGQIAPWWKGWGVQELKFEPLPDGESFRVAAQFRDEVPPPFADAGVKVGHATDGQIEFRVFGWAGNMKQTGPDTFRVQFDREGVNGRTLHVLIGAIHPGNAEYRETMAAAHFFLPGSPDGAKQTIAFPEIHDVTAATKSILLGATSDSGLPVRYYVSWGPAKIDGDTLRLAEIPARAKYPIEVKVTAYQWGKATDPKIASAQSVTCIFHITQQSPTPKNNS